MNEPTTSAGQHPRAAEMGIAPGSCAVALPSIEQPYCRVFAGTKYIATFPELHFQHARLCANALNTMNAVGKLPSELAAVNAALREAVRELRDVMQNVLADIYAYGWSRHCDDIRNAITKTEQLT
jgi:Arc/MetJ family transcription regulator